jgi:hypothetical protein
VFSMDTAPDLTFEIVKEIAIAIQKLFRRQGLLVNGRLALSGSFE